MEYHPPQDNPQLPDDENRRALLGYWLALLSADTRWRAHADQAHYAKDLADALPDDMTAQDIDRWQREIIDFMFILYCMD
jgi:hypothetical protein